MKKFYTLVCAVFFASHIFAQTVAGFENLQLPADSFWNGSNLSGGFTNGNAFFTNDYGGGYWSGFTYSNKKNDTTAGMANQYSAITAGGYGGSATYAVANDYGDAKVRLTAGCQGTAVKGFYVTNATYAYLSMKNGDMFAKKFGGATGTDPDWFRLNVQGWRNGTLNPQKVEFYLADFRNSDSTQDYILNTWAWVDLLPLGTVDSLVFHLESTDTAGGFGMNNPAYFVLDNFTTYETLVPVRNGFETLALAADSFWNGSDQTGGFASDHAFFTNSYDITGNYWSGFTYSNKKDSVTTGAANQYSAITAGGANGSSTYAIANDYGNAQILLTGAATTKPVKGFYVTNTTYAYITMRDGDMFAKKFGGANGTDADWFKLTVLGYLNGALKAQSVDFFLADYRDANSANDYIVRDWRWVDLTTLGNVDSLEFHLSSTDTAGGFGMNNPAYFALDNFAAYSTPVANDDVVNLTYLNDTTISILTNDLDLAYDNFTVELISGSQIAGSVADLSCGVLHYKPAVGIVASDILYYRVVDADGNADTAMVVINIDDATAIADVQPQAMEFAVYPNPFAGNNVTIVAGEEAIGSDLMVYDLSGKLISAERITSRYTSLNTQELSSGVYFVRVSSVSGSSVKKIVKQ